MFNNRMLVLIMVAASATCFSMDSDKAAHKRANQILINHAVLNRVHGRIDGKSPVTSPKEPADKKAQNTLK